jgi:endonuclease I
MCDKCLTLLCDNITLQRNRKLNIINKIFINKFNGDCKNIQWNPQETQLEYIERILQSCNIKDLISNRLNYYNYINEYVISYLYSKNYDKTYFDIYSYQEIDDMRTHINLEHVIPISYFKEKIQRDDIESIEIYKMPMYYDIVNMLPSRQIINVLRKNFMYSDIPHDDAHFIISKNKIILPMIECLNNNSFSKVYNNLIRDEKIIFKKDEYIHDTNTNLLYGKYCDFGQKDKTYCDTCYLEPLDIAKGDIARTILNCYVTYYKLLNTIQHEGIQELKKKIPMFIRWVIKHPVNKFEIEKNYRLEYLTNVCNPFIYYYNETGQNVKMSDNILKHLFLGIGEHEKIVEFINNIKCHKDIEYNNEIEQQLNNISRVKNMDEKLKIVRSDPIERQHAIKIKEINIPMELYHVPIQLNKLTELQKIDIPSKKKLSIIRQPQQSGGYYEKYIKYKNKYLELCYLLQKK